MNIEKLIAEKQGTIIDVRTPLEFRSGHAKGSINIPLQELPLRLDELKSLQTPIIACCASGNRSGQAVTLLSTQGLACLNGGSWLEVNYYQSKTV